VLKRWYALKIKWVGHSCFLMTSDKGVKVITDPFDEKVGYPLPDEEADIVTVSHNHYDHNNVNALKGDFTLFESSGKHSVKGVDIVGISTFHDDAGGAKRGSNIVFIFNIDGIKICHLGDLGHMPNQKQLELIGAIDVLLIPVGGIYTLDYNQAAKVMNIIKPVVTIPMHYKTDVLSFKLDGVDRFLSHTSQDGRVGKQEIELKKESLSLYSGVTVLEYK
jgi:L-ascorbate metabolism protein UlaG (beta-lactamase superfamily)